ncbi:MAG TPA: polyprenyl synthetase family protein, partial [Bacteroidota bacterium]|nr:polyprenyl synthetase family protein [Bacteroidota bacterium]
MRSPQRRYEALRRMVDRRLRSVMSNDHPKELTEACQYVLTAGGKRVRSVLVLLACEAVGGKAAQALDAAAAVEILHNFTLVHDD